MADALSSMHTNVLDPILQILVEDARTPLRSIATMVGSEEHTVEARVRTWERDRLIVRYKAVIDRERAGINEVTAIIEIRVNLQSGLGYEQVAHGVARFDQVRSLYLMSGDYDLLAVVVGATMRDVSTFVAENLAPLEGIQSVNTHFQFRVYKEDGDIFGDVDIGNSRLPVTP
jgi:DNA-binding Lrp family transcriptional regulator